MKTKENVIKNIIHRYIMEDDDSKLKQILKEELSTLNPMKIDEDRMKKMFLERYSFNWDNTQVKEMTKQYNATIGDHQVLQPLPSDEKTLNKISNIIIRYKDEHIYIEEAEKQIIEEVISPILASHVARILELEEKVKLINGDLDSSLEIINSLRSSCP